MKLSIIIPVFNEEKTVAKVIDRITNLKIPGVIKEIVIIDDGSEDSSGEIVRKRIKGTGIKFIKHEKNQGKGRAVRTGIKASTGDYIVIQDADLEYNPKYIIDLVNEVKNKKAEVVYGSRLNRLPNLSKEEKSIQFLLHYFGNRFLSLFISILYMHWLTDMETCYKLFPRKAVSGINLKAKGFELEPEITSKLLKKGYKIVEIPITATPRGYKEGKKLNTVKDGVKAFYSIIKYRFRN